MEDDCDIIIIGAGIAGTACALRCARAGLSVLLLERAEIPGSNNNNVAVVFHVMPQISRT
ncbi:FAD-dependent oxidoreductase, partial [Escherichia sp. HC-CC]